MAWEKQCSFIRKQNQWIGSELIRNVNLENVKSVELI